MAIAGLLLAAAVLPLSPHPAPPFPKIITDAPVIYDVAPGISYGDYQMLTPDGPLSVHVVSVDLHNPQVRIGAALAHGHLVSSGETVSSMANRTGAVAGINGDYFDISQTNQPLNILIENGVLERMPMHRWALSFDQNGTPQFSEFEISAQALLAQGSIPLKTVNDWPPPGGGAVLITPAYGNLKPEENVTEYTLEELGGTPPFATYRVTGIADNTRKQEPGYYLAIGPQAYGSVPLPDTGQTLSVRAASQPSIDGIVTAIGGGPLLVRNGAWYADPDGPNTGEFLTHMPATAAGITREGRLLLFEIDGRQPALSIGLLQPQIASLMIAFGVENGMQFDGGGSSTIVARLPGQSGAAVQNSPSDGQERRVGDALLVYSDAPYGPPAKIAVMPQTVRVFPSAAVPLHVAVTDAGGHAVHACTCNVHFAVFPAGAGRVKHGTFFAGKKTADAVVRITIGALRTEVPVHVTTAVARAQIWPPEGAVRERQRLQLSVRAFDAQGYPIALPRRLPWQTSHGTITDLGDLQASDRDADVSVRLGNFPARELVKVGEHDEPISLQGAAFSSYPHHGPGAIRKAVPCPECITLDYDFTGRERAAYIDATVELPKHALAVGVDVYGDGNGEILRVALNNAMNERFLYTLANVDWHGWRRVEIEVPAEMAQPLWFKALYVINRVGPTPAVRAAGSIAVRNLHVTLAGRAPHPPVQ